MDTQGSWRPTMEDKRKLIESAHSRERHNGRADGAVCDGSGIGQEVQHGRLEGRKAKAHHHSPGDGHRCPEA